MNRKNSSQWPVLTLAVTAIFGGCAVIPSAAGPSASDPLPSWREGKTKQTILEFVTGVTTPGRLEFVAPADRIATFDNDGCLWAEKPMYFQLAFIFARVAELAPKHPDP